MNNSNPWGPKQTNPYDFRKPPAPQSVKPKHNFWGDMDGDGKETIWDDVLGDGILFDAMEAQQRAARGEPAEPEDEFLIGPRWTGIAKATGSWPSSAGTVLVGALFVLGFACLIGAIFASIFGQ